MLLLATAHWASIMALLVVLRFVVLPKARPVHLVLLAIEMIEITAGIQVFKTNHAALPLSFGKPAQLLHRCVPLNR